MLPPMFTVGRVSLDTRMLLLIGCWLLARVVLDRLATGQSNGQALAERAFDAAAVGAIVGGKVVAVLMNPALLAAPEIIVLGDVIAITGAFLGALIAIGWVGWRARADGPDLKAAAVLFIPAGLTFYAGASLVGWLLAGDSQWLVAGALAALGGVGAWALRRTLPPWRSLFAAALGGGLAWLTLLSLPGSGLVWETFAAIVMGLGGAIGLFWTTWSLGLAESGGPEGPGAP